MCLAEGELLSPWHVPPKANVPPTPAAGRQAFLVCSLGAGGQAVTSAGACPSETNERADRRGKEEAALAAVAAVHIRLLCASVSFVLLLLLCSFAQVSAIFSFSFIYFYSKRLPFNMRLSVLIFFEH